MSRRERYEEIVSHPGKFEGEPPWTPYFYEMSMDGLIGNPEVVYEGDEVAYTRFEIEDEDIALFPELRPYAFALLSESDQGFAHVELEGRVDQ